VIIRTASEGTSEEALDRAVRRLQAQSEVIKEKPDSPKAQAPQRAAGWPRHGCPCRQGQDGRDNQTKKEKERWRWWAGCSRGRSEASEGREGDRHGCVAGEEGAGPVSSEIGGDLRASMNSSTGCDNSSLHVREIEGGCGTRNDRTPRR
jgi:hypothetical protein